MPRKSENIPPLLFFAIQQMFYVYRFIILSLLLFCSLLLALTSVFALTCLLCPSNYSILPSTVARAECHTDLTTRCRTICRCLFAASDAVQCTVWFIFSRCRHHFFSDGGLNPLAAFSAIKRVWKVLTLTTLCQLLQLFIIVRDCHEISCGRITFGELYVISAWQFTT